MLTKAAGATSRKIPPLVQQAHHAMQRRWVGFDAGGDLLHHDGILSRRAHELADLLGDHHDLSVLHDYVEVHPQHFADAPTRSALLAVIDRRRDELSRRALKLGRRVYKRSPKRFVAEVKGGWRKRVQVA